MERPDILNQTYLNPENVREIKRGIATQVEALSPDTRLLGAAASVGASLLLRIMGRHLDAQFVGQWAPTLLLVGLYAKGGTLTRSEQASEMSTATGTDKSMH